FCREVHRPPGCALFASPTLFRSSASCVVSSTAASLPTDTVIVGPWSANCTLPPRSIVLLSFAVSPSKSVISALPVSVTRPLPRRSREHTSEPPAHLELLSRVLFV